MPKKTVKPPKKHDKEFYEGLKCPRCQSPFDPGRDRRITKDWLIAAGVDPPVYERQDRCRCQRCKELFELDIKEATLCGECGKSLFTPKEIAALGRNARTSLQMARAIDHARRHLTHCPHCRCEPETFCWCPRCGSKSEAPPESCLPEQATKVWTPTFYTRTSDEDLQRSQNNRNSDLQISTEEVEDRVDHE